MFQLKKTALVTGGAGFIGSHTTDALIAQGWKVIVVDDLSSGNLDNLRHLRGNPCFSFMRGDICDVELMKRLLHGADEVFHFAAQVSVPLSIDDPEGCYRVNIDAFKNLLLLCKERKLPVFYASSAAVYGNRGDGVRDEEEAPRPLSPFGASKAIDEMLASAAWNSWGVPAVGFRFFNVYGPRQNPNGAYASIIPKFCSVMACGSTPVIYGDGEQTRDFIHVKDVAAIIVKMSDMAKENGGRVFNVATGVSISVNALLKAISDKISIPPKADYKPARAGDIVSNAADISRLKSALKDIKFTDINEGLVDTVEWYKA
ncbi:MAG: GDP-mannose 4,6-dehydratase [Synergistaceae bacterium]|nr:GDP-mannose 4,6-dehydratase [Synergistaceae bacterium]